MEELKQLIREDKVLLDTVDKDVRDLRELLAGIKEALLLFPPFFERQDRFMDAMMQYLDAEKPE